MALKPTATYAITATLTGNKLKIEESKVVLDTFEDGYANFEIAAAAGIIVYAKASLCRSLPALFGEKLKEFKDRPDAKTSAAKQAVAKLLNGIVARFGLTFINPDNEEPCNLVAISDVWGGKFTLENRVTKKRTHGTKDPSTLPIVLLPLANPVVEYSTEWINIKL